MKFLKARIMNACWGKQKAFGKVRDQVRYRIRTRVRRLVSWAIEDCIWDQTGCMPLFDIEKVTGFGIRLNEVHKK